MTDKNILHARLAKARAIINSPELALLKAEAAKTQSKMDWIKEQFNLNPNSTAKDAERGYAKQALSKAADAVARLEANIRKARQEAVYLERLLNADAALVQAREGWHSASAAQVQATKATEAARENLSRLDAQLADEERKIQVSKEARANSILVKLGFSDKPDGETANASAKARIDAEDTIYALRTARPDIENRVALADAALATCDKATRQAEQAILEAKQSIAERAQVIALDATRAAVLACHAATLAATGRPGEPVVIYDQSEGLLYVVGQEGRDYMEQEAERIKAAAIVGE
ncbi:MAG: hypothetical protein JWP93_2336 [Polaromonas sp.]|nr:hypothetical protein [Polaromonas sp.]